MAVVRSTFSSTEANQRLVRVTNDKTPVTSGGFVTFGSEASPCALEGTLKLAHVLALPFKLGLP